METRLFDYALDILNKIQVMAQDELVSASEIEIDLDKNPGIMKLLSLVGAIKTTQGTQRFYINKFDLKAANEMLATISIFAKEIDSILQKTPVLSRKEIVPLLEKAKINEADYNDCLSLLASLNISTSAGKGRTGGISRYNNDEIVKNIESAKIEIAKEKNEDKKEKKSNEHEKVLYPNAEKFLLELGYDPIILGVNKKLKGKWNTPDIIGYSIEGLSVIGGAYLETVSIEVKWKMSKDAIAEANSHQKLVNKSYLWVNQEIEDIDEEYLLEIAEKGLGLICLKNSMSVMHCAAKYSSATDYQINNFLETALTGDYAPIKDEIKTEIARKYYVDYFKSQMS